MNGNAALIALLLAACAQPDPEPASADPVYRQGSYSVTLLETPCPWPEFVAELEHEGIPPARLVLVQSGERRYSGCWAKDLSGDVMLRDTAGGDRVLPGDGFRPQPVKIM